MPVISKACFSPFPSETRKTAKGLFLSRNPLPATPATAPGCCASKKAVRVQEERLSHRVSSVAFKEKYSFNVDTMDIEGLVTRVYE
jgi:hypothetical protein